jgi:hypothetical protein
LLLPLLLVVVCSFVILVAIVYLHVCYYYQPLLLSILLFPQ